MLKAIYEEDDWIAEVEILEDNCGEISEEYKLKVIKTIQESKIYSPVANGQIFKASQVRSNPIVFVLRYMPVPMR